MSWERNRLKLINRLNKWRRKSKSNNKKEKLVVNKKEKEVVTITIIKIGENNSQLKNKLIKLSDMPVEVYHHHLQGHRLQKVGN